MVAREDAYRRVDSTRKSEAQSGGELSRKLVTIYFPPNCDSDCALDL